MTAGVNLEQLLLHVIRPVILHLGVDKTPAARQAAEELILGTIIQESHGRHLKQLGGGPALGLSQMEPATHDDIWSNYLRYKLELSEKVRALELPAFAQGAEELPGNLYYAVAMTRVHYLRVPEALPRAGDLPNQARYWKEHYNTYQGAGKRHEYELNWCRFSPLRSACTIGRA